MNNHEMATIAVFLTFLFSLVYCIFSIEKIKYKILFWQKTNDRLSDKLTSCIGKFTKEFSEKIQKNSDAIIAIKNTQVSQTQKKK